MLKVTVDVINPRSDSIYSQLAEKLGRAPTNAECREECFRILDRVPDPRQPVHAHTS
jgi:hypothetical protein